MILSKLNPPHIQIFSQQKLIKGLFVICLVFPFLKKGKWKAVPAEGQSVDNVVD